MPTPASPRLIRTYFCLWLLAACGGVDPAERAEEALSLGRLDRAEALLGSNDSPLAQDVRRRLARAQSERAQWLSSLEGVLLRVGQGSKGAMGELELMGRESLDAWQRDQIAQARSRGVDLLAEAHRAGPLAKKIRPVRQEPGTQAMAARIDELTLLVLADVRGAMEAREWARAEEELIGIRLELELGFPELTELEKDLSAAVTEDVALVLAASEREQTLRGAHSELSYLAEQRWRFLRQGVGSAVHERWNELAKELGEPLEFAQNFTAEKPASVSERADSSALGHVASPAAPETIHEEFAPEPGAVAARAGPGRWETRTSTLAIDARRLVRDGQLAEATDRYQQAALQSVGAEQARFSARARDAGERGRLRSKLQKAFKAQPFEDLSEIDGSGLVLAGVGRDWADLELPELLALSSAAGVESSLGLTLELLGLYDGSGWEEGGRRLYAAELDQVITGWERNEWLALHRGQARIPVGGYLWDQGLWMTATEVDASALGERLVALGGDLGKGKPKLRDAAFIELQSLAVGNLAAAESLKRNLNSRLESAKKILMKSSTMRRLESLAGRRALLDKRREEVLALIGDEMEYFYPYLMPSVSSEEAAAYRALQRRISGMVAVIELDWVGGAHGVPMNRRFREALEDLHWCLEVMEQGGGMDGGMVRLPEGIPSWIEGIDSELEKVGLAQFAWSRSGVKKLGLGRAIQRRNVELWAQLKGARKLSREEIEEVKVTNRYRLMLGRQALGWNPMLQAASLVHSEYMDRTGHFGHDQEGVRDRTPAERRHRQGYKYEGGENCHMGNLSPVEIHAAWAESSAHHRNLLSRSYHEVGVSRIGAYWTQVFGSASGWMNSVR